MRTRKSKEHLSRPVVLASMLAGIGAAQAGTVVDSTPANNQATLASPAGQTFTVGDLGLEDSLSTITLRGPASGSGATVYTMKVWVDTDGDFTTWDPGDLVATSTNSLPITNGGNSIFTFSNELLSSNTVYAFSLSAGGVDNVSFRPGLTNAAGVALTDGALFSGGGQPFGGAFDASFIVNTIQAGNGVVWNAAIDTTWDVATTANWQFPGGGDTTFADGNDVLFDDTDTVGAVALSGVIQPSSTTFDAATTSYTLSGDAIAGDGNLTVQQGAVTLLNNNTFTGSTNIVSGSLNLGNGGTTGDVGFSNINNEGVLAINRSDSPIFENVISGGGSLLVNGTGTVTMAGISSFTGGTTINGGGTLLLGNADGIGRSGPFGGGFVVRDGTFDTNGYENYANLGQPNGPRTWLTISTVTLGGQAGGTPVIADSSEFPLGIAFANGTALVYDATNDPNTATVSARWTQTGTTGTGTRNVVVGDSAATDVELDFTGGLGDVTAVDGFRSTIRKIGAGTMRISSENTFPGLQVSEGTLLVNDVNALGASRTANGGATNLVTVDATGVLDLNGVSPSAQALSDGGVSTGTITNNVAGTTSILNIGSAGISSSYGGIIADGDGIVGLSVVDGTFTLSGTKTYTGTSSVTNGTLRLNTTALASEVVVSGDGIVGAGTADTVGTGNLDQLTLNGGTASFRLSDLGSDKLVVGADGLTIESSTTIDPVDVDLDGLTLPFTADVIEYSGAIQGAAGFSGLAVSQHGPITLTDTGTAIQLTITNEPADTLVWVGGVDGSWSINGSSNWQLASDSSSVPFYKSDQVVFDDTATGQTTVTLSSSVSPQALEFNNSTLDYILQGASIDGTANFLKNGTASTTILCDGGYTGGTTINAGSLTFGDGATSGEIGFGPVSIAEGATLTISRSDLLDYKTTPKMRVVSGAGDLVFDGGGVFFNYTGGGVGFNDPDTWSLFSGDITVINGSELQSIRNGANALGTGSIILGDATTSGTLSQIEGNWTRTQNIQLVGSDNFIANNSAGIDRWQKLQGVISGAGNLTFIDNVGAMNDLNRGFILTGDNTATGTITIAAGTPLRVGGIPGENTDQFAAPSGSLGTAEVVNNGTLTFSRTDAHTVNSTITGLGTVRVGVTPGSAGDGTLADPSPGDISQQVVTFASSQSYEGDTEVLSGTLNVPSGQTLGSGFGFISVDIAGTVSGAGTLEDSVDIFGTVDAGDNGVGTLTTSGPTIFYGGSNLACDLGDWTTASSDQLVAQDSLEFFIDTTLETPDEPMTIVIDPASLTGFTETDQTFTLISSPNGIFGFDVASVTVDDSAFFEATPATGTWSVQENGTGDAIELVYTAGIPPVTNDFTAWIDGFFAGETDTAIIGFNADPDGDGLGNGLENFLGTAPNSFDAGLSGITSGVGSVTASHSQSNDVAVDVVGSYEWSTDLVNWNASGVTAGGVTAEISSSITDDQEAPANDTVEVTATVTSGSDNLLFLRAKATQQTAP